MSRRFFTNQPPRRPPSFECIQIVPDPQYAVNAEPPKKKTQQPKKSSIQIPANINWAAPPSQYAQEWDEFHKPKINQTNKFKHPPQPKSQAMEVKLPKTKPLSETMKSLITEKKEQLSSRPVQPTPLEIKPKEVNQKSKIATPPPISPFPEKSSIVSCDSPPPVNTSNFQRVKNSSFKSQSIFGKKMRRSDSLDTDKPPNWRIPTKYNARKPNKPKIIFVASESDETENDEPELPPPKPMNPYKHALATWDIIFS